MANRTKKAGSKAAGNSPATEPKFPYATTPNALRKFLELIPKKPKLAKINEALLQSWGLRNTNDRTIIRVLKALKLISPNNEPTERYIEYMSPTTGPAVLAQAAREVWEPLFNTSHAPHKEDDATIRNYFHIHSGGSEATIGFQIQTLKAVCDLRTFQLHQTLREAAPIGKKGVAASATSVGNSFSSGGNPAIHIDLHIHLPENKNGSMPACP